MPGPDCDWNLSAAQHEYIPKLLVALQFYASPEGVSREGGIKARTTLEKWKACDGDGWPAA